MLAEDQARYRPEQMDPAWLTTVLRQAGLIRDARVTDIEHAPVGVGMMGDSARVQIRYDRDEEAPSSIIAKFAAADPTSRATGRDFGLYEAEVRFYEDIASTVAVRAPRCYYSDLDKQSGKFLLLLEDMTPARAGNQLTGCSVDDARQAMIQAAALHGPRWADPALPGIAFMQTRGAAKKVVADNMPAFIAEFHRRYDDIFEPEYMAVADRYAEVAGMFLADEYAPFTLTHYDFRLDNMLFDARDGAIPLTILDWQSISVSSGALDVSYFLGAGISIEDRRKHERELLELYLEELRRYGVRDYSYDQLWRDYRITLFQGVSTAIFAAAATRRTERGDAMYLAMARGSCAQAIDVDAFDALLEYHR